MQKYTRKELAELYFNISVNTFNNQKKKYLDHLSQYYIWHMEGRMYILDEEIKPWEPVKKGRSISKNKIQDDYTIAMHEIIDNDPSQFLNSGANLTRHAELKNPNQICRKYNHHRKTMQRYFIKSLDQEYPNAERVWAKKVDDFHYELLTKEEEESLNKFLDRYYNPITGSKKAEIAGLLASKEITKDEALNILFEEEGGMSSAAAFYNKVISKFVEEFGYYPVKVRKLDLEKSAF